MKNHIISFLLAGCFFSSCVQQSYKREIVLLLDVSGNPNIQTVGVRGSDKPLSWEFDTPLTVITKDSLYKAIVTIDTGRLCTELKFTVNGNFELREADNRKVNFNPNGSTIYKAKFNVIGR